MNLTNPMKIVLALILLVLTALGFWLLDWQEKAAELAQARAARAELEQRLAATRALAAELPALTREKEGLERELAVMMKGSLPDEDPKMFVARFLESLEGLVMEERARSGDPSFAIVTVTPGAPTASTVPSDAPAEPASPLRSLPNQTFQIGMQGRYDTLVDFLARLGQMGLGRPVTLNRIALAPAGTGNGSPVLSITLPMTAYGQAR